MKSDELNSRIDELCDEPEKCGGFEIFGGKAIPYIGWYWRDVDFDREDSKAFGVLPSGEVGFMERNKWGYGYVTASPEQWKEIKQLLIEAVTNPTFEAFKSVNDAIQALASKDHVDQATDHQRLHHRYPER